MDYFLDNYGTCSVVSLLAWHVCHMGGCDTSATMSGKKNINNEKGRGRKICI